MLLLAFSHAPYGNAGLVDMVGEEKTERTERVELQAGGTRQQLTVIFFKSFKLIRDNNNHGIVLRRQK